MLHVEAPARGVRSAGVPKPKAGVFGLPERRLKRAVFKTLLRGTLSSRCQQRQCRGRDASRGHATSETQSSRKTPWGDTGQGRVVQKRRPDASTETSANDVLFRGKCWHAPRNRQRRGGDATRLALVDAVPGCRLTTEDVTRERAGFFPGMHNTPSQEVTGCAE